ncbi:OmpA family domain-containing protein [Nitratireductor pacificus pht-3B]|uniref:OmpA family domain-containing protein n=2 Tax=Nitratireductor TaxID=245876 RepID=K2LRS3_9HYPH|nr:OmpA family domain-containing protein [Nitratireductor pacificus pht-3B]
MLSKRILGFVLACGMSLTGIAHAQDVEGSSDHPLLTRFTTATIRSYEVRDYDEALLPAGRIDDSETTGNLLKLEGKVTRIGYRIPGDHSVLEVMRNYEAALAQAGFETLFACNSHEACGIDMMALIANTGRVRPTAFGDAFFGETGERALLARRDDGDGPVHVFLHAVEDTSTGRTVLYQQVVEAVGLSTGQVKVLQADELKKSLERMGHVTVSGVYFDTGRAEIKPESDPALGEMARLLEADPALTVYIVGHTDNVGSLAANVTLSQARAAAVVERLAADFGIDRARLSPQGVASLAPLANNSAETGRARNRRVELVVQ